jgi:hypothetical protein
MAITLLEMLLDAGLLSPAQCDESLQNRVFFGGKIGTSLIELGLLDEEKLARFLSRKLGVPFVHPDRFLDIPIQVIRLLSRELALKYRVIPLSLEKRRLSLAMADPSDLRAIDEIAFITGHVIRPLVSPEVRLVQALGKYYGLKVEDRYRQIIDHLNAGSGEHGPESVEFGKQEWATWDEGEVAEMTKFAEGPAESPEDGAEPEMAEERVFWLERIEQYSPDPVSIALATADGREEIADAIISFLGREAELGALFLVRDGTAYGWRAAGRGKELEGIRLLQIPVSGDPVLKTVSEDRRPYLGPLEGTSLNTLINDGMGIDCPAWVTALPLVLGEKVVNILFLAGREGDLAARLTGLEKLLAKAALAFEILVAREKILTM